MRKSRLRVDDLEMAYIEVGSGAPIVFLHGNPTSSFLWRNVIPALADLGRCIAPDLVGMGDSDPVANSGPDSYRFADHRAYLDGLLAGLGAERDVTFVVHDWGSALRFDWARRHRDAIKGIAYMEAIVRPVLWTDWPEPARALFEAMRSPAGEDIVLAKNVFVERILPASVLGGLADDVMTEYRRPYVEPGEARRPTLSWPREIPIDGSPADVYDIVRAYSEWLVTSDVPKLFVNAEPGSILVGNQRELCRTWPNQVEVTVAGSHFLQEDSPVEIGSALADWYRSLDWPAWSADAPVDRARIQLSSVLF